MTKEKDVEQQAVVDSQGDRPFWTPPEQATKELITDSSVDRADAPGDMQRVEAEAGTESPLQTVADRDSDTNARWLKLAWASFGNATFQGRLSLRDWYRHKLTWSANCIFRDASTGALLASDGFEWLSWMHHRGAVRLSVEMRPDLEEIGNAANLDKQVIVCHFPDSNEIWTIGEEFSDAMRLSSDLGWEARDAAFPLYGWGSYLPELHCYWRIAEEQPSASPLPVDWTWERANIEKALQAEEFSSYLRNKAADAFYRGVSSDDPEWSRYPVLPDDQALRIPHQLLFGLTQYKAYWDNACHMKNEVAYEAQAQGDERFPGGLDAHRDLVASLIGRVQCLAGSETRWKPKLHAPP